MLGRLGVVGLAIIGPACTFEAGGSTVVDATPGDAIDADRSPDATADTEIELRVNVFGGSHVGIDFPGTWAAESGECNGNGYTVAGEVTGTQDDPLFNDYRFSDLGVPMQCDVGAAIPGGDYEVTLLFGEVFNGQGCEGGGGVGSRSFDILIEGQERESAFDPYAEGGCCSSAATSPGQPVVRTFTQSVSDGTVSLEFAPAAGTYAMISAIQIRGPL